MGDRIDDSARDCLALVRADNDTMAVLIEGMTPEEVRLALANMSGFTRGLIQSAAEMLGTESAAFYDRWKQRIDEQGKGNDEHTRP